MLKVEQQQLTSMLQALIIAVHRAGGEFRFTRADYEAALAAVGTAPGWDATFHFDPEAVDPDHPENDTMVVTLVPEPGVHA